MWFAEGGCAACDATHTAEAVVTTSWTLETPSATTHDLAVPEALETGISAPFTDGTWMVDWDGALVGWDELVALGLPSCLCLGAAEIEPDVLVLVNEAGFVLHSETLASLEPSEAA